MRILALALLLPATLKAQTKVLVIGDSLSAEYEYSAPFSAPDSDRDNPNIDNWIEILEEHRPAEINFGSRDVYADIRLAGYKYNWGWPGAETESWEVVFKSTATSNLFYWNSKRELLDQLHDVDVAVILLGGNDVSKVYGHLYDNTPPADFPEAIISRYTYLLDELRSERGDLPLVIVNAPDVGATPEIQEDHPDPLKRADATNHIITLNTRFDAVAQTYNATLVDFFDLTTAVIANDPYYIGSQEMVKSYHPENPPNYLFCKLRFHPSTGLNAQLANMITGGINTELGTNISKIPDREIISAVLKLNPDQVFLDWANTYPGTTPTFLSDDDGDSLCTLAEFALGTHPLIANPPPSLHTVGADRHLRFPVNPDATRFVQTIPEESTNLQLWTPTPPERLNTFNDGHVEATLPSAPGAFGRLRFLLQP